MERLIDKVRREYPNPITLDQLEAKCEEWDYNLQGKPKNYCVWIAWSCYCAQHGITHPIRNQDEIIAANDSGNIEKAWELVAQAIEGKDGTRRP